MIPCKMIPCKMIPCKMIPCKQIWTIAAYLFATMTLPVWTTAQDNPPNDHKAKHSQYKLIDLGTLGGPQSFLFDYFVRNINNSGTVIALMDTPTPEITQEFQKNGVRGVDVTLPCLTGDFLRKQYLALRLIHG
jgi:hypothetical protein